MKTFGAARCRRPSALRLARGVVLLVTLATWPAAGCSKHEWLAHRRTENWSRTTAADSVRWHTSSTAGTAVPGAGTEPMVAPEGSTTPASPVESGAIAIPAPAEAVTELPWEPAPSTPPDVSRVGCSGADCYWIQVAALADSSGAATALAKARAAAARPGAVSPAAGGSIAKEGGLWKVRLGPWGRWEDADAALSAVRAGGFPGAWLVRRDRFSG